MNLFCITVPRPGPRLRAVIIIVVYLIVARLAPADMMPMAAGSLLGLLATGPTGHRRADVALEAE